MRKVIPSFFFSVLSVLLISQYAAAKEDSGWNCRNTDFEISCDQTGCKALDTHTPMDIYLDDEGVEVCAYSGCWSGAPTYMRRGGGFEIWTGYNLPFSTQTDSEADISITLDVENHVANVLVSALFALPATCEPWIRSVD